MRQLLTRCWCTKVCVRIPPVMSDSLWIAMLSSRGSSQPRDLTESLTSPTLAGRSFTTSVTWEVPNTLFFNPGEIWGAFYLLPEALFCVCVLTVHTLVNRSISHFWICFSSFLFSSFNFLNPVPWGDFQN